jgi:23S rRNA (guanosine2251-2'-O)-methyltransferase
VKNIYVALENVRSLHNVGAIFRTCSFFGVKNVLLIGYTAKDFDHLGNPHLHEKVAKTALGAEEELNIRFLKDTNELIDFANTKKLRLVVVEQARNSTDLKSFTAKERSKKGSFDNMLLVFGNELDGVSKILLDVSDKIIEITGEGSYHSLNITTACGIVLSVLA